MIKKIKEIKKINVGQKNDSREDDKLMIFFKAPNLSVIL